MQSGFWAANASVSPSRVWLLPPGVFFSDCNYRDICNGITSLVTNYNIVTVVITFNYNYNKVEKSSWIGQGMKSLIPTFVFLITAITKA